MQNLKIHSKDGGQSGDCLGETHLLHSFEEEMKAGPLITALRTQISVLLLLWPVRCVEWNKQISSHSRPLLFVIAHITATLVRSDPQMWVFLLCDEARAVSQLHSCVQLVGEMFLWISVWPNRLGQERRGPVRNPKLALLCLLTQCLTALFCLRHILTGSLDS